MGPRAPPTMRAAVLGRTGGPEVLEVKDVEDPRPARGEVRLRVRATSVNRLDLFIRDGTYPVPLPHILGADVVGEVESIGPDPPPRMQVGDRVIAFPGLSCGRCPWCRQGRESLCPQVGIVGRARAGGYAELCCLPSESLYALPPDVPWDVAGAIPLTYLTAEHLISRAGIVGGETALILGATGGVGMALLDLLAHRGVRTIAATRQEGTVSVLREQGARDVIVTEGPDLPEKVGALTGGNGAEVVLDLVGASTWDGARRSLGRGGRHVIAGVASGDAVPLNLRSLYNPQQAVLGSFLGDRTDFIRVLGELRAGRLRPKVHATFPLDRVVDAHREIDRPHVGKIVLRT